MVFGRDMDVWEVRPGHVDFVERETTGIFPSVAEVKLIGIAGVGFFMDSYDLFIINMIVPILQLVYYNNKTIPWGLDGGVLKAAANIGNIIGQLGFGFLGDSYGRQFVYGKELIIVIIAVVAMISAPNSWGGGVTYWVAAWRFVMGIGIGGDYPISAAVVADRANLRRRGALLAVLFSGQGWGGFIGALLAVIVIAAYQHQAEAPGYLALSGAWRILQGLSLVPALFVLYFRLTMAESTKFTEARKLQDDPDLIYSLHRDGFAAASKEDVAESDRGSDRGSDEDAIVRQTALGFKAVGRRPHVEFFSYFSEFRHLKILIGTAMTWFLLDIAFYGINLNQASILQILYPDSNDKYTNLRNIAVGNLIIIAAGYLFGYFFSVIFIEKIGRLLIQHMGFAVTALLLFIAGGDYDSLRKKHAPFIAVFALLQFFFNFGANTTTFVIPAEVFPSRVRTTAHGFSAACGKLGAVAASLGFEALSKDIGRDKVLLIFGGVSLAGIPFTFLIPETKGRDADVIDREELVAKAHGQNRTAGARADLPAADGPSV